MGLAAHARVSAKIAEYLKGLAENLEAHVPTIDTSDPSGRAEREAYVRLANEYEATGSAACKHGGADAGLPGPPRRPSS